MVADKPLRVATLGECMIELYDAGSGDAPLSRTFGGDAFNTAAYLRRCLSAADAVAFVTAFGEDPYSQSMLEFIRSNEVSTVLSLTVEDKLPGLYFIRTDSRGERSFFYWRDNSAARELFNHPDIGSLCATLESFDLLYFTGISLAILDSPGQQKLLSLARAIRQNGGQVAFDPNFRAVLWPEVEVAQDLFREAAGVSDFALPTLDDERALYQIEAISVEEVAASWLDHGAREVIVKAGSTSTLVQNASQTIRVAPEQRNVKVVDTTAAGDSFNAAYLAARLKGMSESEATARAHALAAFVVQHRGAVVPTPDPIEALFESSTTS